MPRREHGYAVRAVRCDHRASRDEIHARLREVTAPLSRSWERLERSRRIGIKVNMQMRTEDIRRVGGRRQELVDEDVLRAALRLLRERTDAEIFVLDTSMAPAGERPGADYNMGPVLDEFDVRYVEAGDPPLARFRVPGGGAMFSEYSLPAILGEADAFVSIAKMKSHSFMGITLCLKNLFGLPPIPPHGRDRRYYHHVIRLPYVLADIGRIVAPCLNIIDGLTGQSGREWGGAGRIADTLVAGDHVVATDACGAFLMGTDPALDWPAPPYRRERSPIAVAARHGFGTVDLREIDFLSEVAAPVASFDSEASEDPGQIAALRRSACEQALFYRENRAALVDRYAGRFVALQGREVLWSGNDPSGVSLVKMAQDRAPDQAAWLKLVDPAESEGERFEVYERESAARP